MGFRILLVSDHYPPYIGGAHRQTQLLGHELFRRGHQVSVATVWSPGLPQRQDDAGVMVYRLKQFRSYLWWLNKKAGQRHQPPFPDPFTVWPLRRLIGALQPDIVHAYGWYAYSCAQALLGKDIPLVISARDYAYSCATRTLLYRGRQTCSGPALLKCAGCATELYGAGKGLTAVLGILASRSLLVRKVRGVHSISSYVQETIRRDLYANQSLPRGAHRTGVKEAIIPSFREDEGDESHGDDPRYQSYIQQLPTEPYILFVGALRRVKGAEQLLTAYKRLVSPPPMVLIGTIERDAPSTFPPGVTVLQNLPHPAVMVAWERCLFGVIPSLWPEPLGSVVYEGMSKGKAMIGTTPGGHTDMIVNGETGLLVPAGDVDALADAMRSLTDNKELRERLGVAAQAHAKLFTAGIAVPQFVHFYNQVIENSKIA